MQEVFLHLYLPFNIFNQAGFVMHTSEPIALDQKSMNRVSDLSLFSFQCCISSIRASIEFHAIFAGAVLVTTCRITTHS